MGTRSGTPTPTGSALKPICPHLAFGGRGMGGHKDEAKLWNMQSNVRDE